MRRTFLETGIDFNIATSALTNTPYLGRREKVIDLLNNLNGDYYSPSLLPILLAPIANYDPLLVSK